VRYLLDTQILIWMRQNDPRLSRAKWEPVFHDPNHEILFSLVSIWEISIKRALGKLKLEGSLADFARTLERDHGFIQISLQLHEICRVETLPFHHQDPFDRLLIAQCIESDAIAVSSDSRWSRYPVQVEI
jgi:PIN domain nuclease of toxin-antitoxin system